MKVVPKKDIKRATIEKELAVWNRQENRLIERAEKFVQPRWKAELEKKVPEKLRSNLEAAFAKAFAIIFTKGTGVIERSYDRQRLEACHTEQDFAVMETGRRREFRQLKQTSGWIGCSNTIIAALEGMGLGALGIGLPDVFIFVGVLLKGIYETALSYGFSYDTSEERLLMLYMIEASLTTGPAFAERNRDVNIWMQSDVQPGNGGIERQLQRAGSILASEMLPLKFVQGIPVVGMLGGGFNPVVYHRIMGYVRLKYGKRYLLSVAKRSGILLSLEQKSDELLK